MKSAVAAGNLTLGALSPLLAAAAGAEQSLVALRLDRLKNWQDLDGLLGLAPTVRFAIAPPNFPPLPADLDALVASLPERRPDLAALRLGYRSAGADLRAAILGQFPPLGLGATYGSDTTGVVSAGPSLTLTLPIFDRNQGRIGAAKATRGLLREQYRARLDAAVAGAHALLAQIESLSADLARARQAAAAAAIAAAARRAYAERSLDQRSLSDYETTALARRIDVRLGELVAKGAPLVHLGPSPATAAAYAQARSALEVAGDLARRTRTLLSQHLATAQELAAADNSEADASTTVAALSAEGAGGPQILRTPLPRS